MKKLTYSSALIAALFVAAPAGLMAEEKKAEQRPNREQLQEELKNLTPEQREARIKQLRERQGVGEQGRPAGQNIDREKMRQELENLTPEQREARMKEMRDRMAKGQGEGQPNPQNNPEFNKLREEFRNMTPEQREARLKELRDKGMIPQGFAPRPGQNQDMTPEQRAARMKEFREQAEKRMAELRQKQANGTLSDEEKQQLQRMEEMSKRINQGGENRPRQNN